MQYRKRKLKKRLGARKERNYLQIQPPIFPNYAKG